jgi:hypothetical protein
MMQKRKNYRGRIAVMAIIVVAILVAIGMAGCAKGTNLTGRPEAIQAMKMLGFKFDSSLLSTEYGGNMDVIIVTGPMIGPKVLGVGIPPKNGSTYTQYSRVVMKREGGKWNVAETTLR